MLRTQRSWPPMLRLVLTETPSTLNPGQDFSADVQHCSTAEWLKKKKKKKLTGWFSCVFKNHTMSLRKQRICCSRPIRVSAFISQTVCAVCGVHSSLLYVLLVYFFVAVRTRCRTRWGTANVLRGSWQEGDWSKVPYCQVRQSQEGSGVVLELFDLSVA